MMRRMPTPGPTLPFAAGWLRDGGVTPNEHWRALWGDPAECRWRPGLGDGAAVAPASLERLLAGADANPGTIYTRDDGIVLELHAVRSSPGDGLLAVVHDVSGVAATL